MNSMPDLCILATFAIGYAVAHLVEHVSRGFVRCRSLDCPQCARVAARVRWLQ